MSLLEQQLQLARLYVSQREREVWRTDDQRLQKQVSQFARSLQMKRLAEVARLLPQTRDQMGPQFRERFLRYSAEAAIPGGVHKHQADAVAFGDWLLRVLFENQAINENQVTQSRAGHEASARFPPAVVASLRQEIVPLRAWLGGRRLAWCRVPGGLLVWWRLRRDEGLRTLRLKR
jgi:hypothetical protein